MPEIVFHGPCGIVEANYTAGKSGYAALVCSPHPLYGGDMDNNIVRMLYDMHVNLGNSVMRFNYRGVGRSVGDFNAGYGETVDANHATDWLLDNNPGCLGIHVAGFSFGAYIASQIAVRRPEAVSLLCVAHPYTLYHSEFIEDWVPRTLMIDGDQDDFVGRYELLDKNIKRATIADTDHFMTGKLPEMARIIEEWI